MGASAYIGRVGGLAVALGVGVAVATGGHGVAWADDTADPESSAQEPSSPPAAEPEPISSPTTNSPSAPKSADPAEPAAGSGPVSTVSAQTGSTVNGEKAGEEKKDDEKKADEADEEVEEEEALVEEDTSSYDAQQIVAVSQTVAERSRKSDFTPRTLTAPKTSAPKALLSTNAAAVAEKPVQKVDQPIRAARTAVVDGVAAVRKTVALSAEAQSAPLMTAAADAPAVAEVSSPPIVNRLLAAFGVGSLATNLPLSPTQPWVFGAFMALASRRESERTISTLARTAASGTPVAAAALTNAPTAAVTPPPDRSTTWVVTPVAMSPNTDFIANVTGPGGLNDTQKRFGIGGTDVGIIWDNGIKDDPTTVVNEHQVLIAFGDTFSNRTPVRTGGWRMNTLFRSSDTMLSNGMYVPDGIPHNPGTYSGTPESNPNFSREIIGNYHYGIGPEVTMIPTAAISVPGAGVGGATRQYVNFMSVRSWDTAGRWTTNYSAIAYSDDNGQNWTVVPAESVRPAAAGRSTRPFVNGNQNFQQFAYVKGAVVDANGVPVKDAVTGQPKTDGYIYAFGTPAGRGGTAYLSRVAERDILDQTKYQYWNGSTWVANSPAAAKPILPGTTSAGFFGFGKTTTYPSVGEMSVQYNAYEKKYVMLYADKNNNVVMRKADRPEGPWSAPTTLVTSTKMPGLYAPMVHPWSSTANLSAADQRYLYWNLSTWDDYQVKLMRTDLSKV